MASFYILNILPVTLTVVTQVFSIADRHLIMFNN